MGVTISDMLLDHLVETATPQRHVGGGIGPAARCRGAGPCRARRSRVEAWAAVALSVARRRERGRCRPRQDLDGHHVVDVCCTGPLLHKFIRTVVFRLWWRSAHSVATIVAVLGAHPGIFETCSAGALLSDAQTIAFQLDWMQQCLAGNKIPEGQLCVLEEPVDCAGPL